MKKRLLFLILFFGILATGFGQTVSILNKTFVVNGNASCPIYFNGANTPWNNWNDFGGNYNSSFWSTHFATLKANGINASRVWISCNGDVQPNINSNGIVTGVSPQFWANLDDFFASAKENGIYIMATMMSFDHTKDTYNNYKSWRNMLNDESNVKTYCANYLVPFVNRYKTNPYLMSIDISNEIEWVAEDATNMKCSYAVLQRFVAMCASSIHSNPRTDGSTVLVTLGSAATKWNGTKMRKGSNGAWSQNNSDGNKWSDAALKAQYNQPNAILDYYSPHYYSWIDEWYSNPFERTPADFGIDEKPVVIGETPAGNPGTPNLSVLASYEALKKNGYQGHFPWTSNGVDKLGDISKFGTDAKTFATTYSALVKPTCGTACATVAPTVKSAIVYCKNDLSDYLTAEGTNLKWYVDNTTNTPLTAAPIPSTSSIGTTNYYVSQTLNKCEGPRALIVVTINDVPISTISTPERTEPVTICADNNVVLTASSGNTYKWRNASGIIAGATNKTYTTAISGSYTVTVTATNNCSATSTPKNIVVNPVPDAIISSTTPSTFCTGSSLLLTSSVGILYQWNNAAGPISGATAATYNAKMTDSYSVTVTNSYKCSATSKATGVTENPIPTATITTTSPTTFCSGETIVLNANTGNGLTYVWKKDGSQIWGSTSSTFSTAASGTYTVTVTANGCAVTSAEKVITVNPTPLATITTTSPTTFCEGGSVLLTANTGNGLTYVWNKDGIPISGATTSTFSALSTGDYTVTVKLNNCSVTSTSIAVTSNPMPSATLTTTSPTIFCSGETIVLTANTGIGLTYVWNKDGSQIWGSTSSTFSAANSGSYTVTVKLNNCSINSAAKVITVNPTPTATITTTSPTTFCEGGSVLLTANTGNGLTYVWNNGGIPISGATSSTFSATSTGIYTVTVKLNSCDRTSQEKAVIVNPMPSATLTTTSPTTFCSGETIVLTANTGNGLTYIWNKDGSQIWGSTSSTFSVANSGSYTVTVKLNNCSLNSTAKVITVNPTPLATITTTSPTTLCEGGSVLLTANTGNGLTYVWNKGGIPISGATSYTYSAITTGVYTVTVKLNSCDRTSEDKVVIVNPMPSATLTTTSPTSFCSGGTILLTANTGNGLTYIWNKDGSQIWGSTSSTFSVANSGSYTVTVKLNNCSLNSAAKVITVNPTPTATITTTTPATFCLGSSLLLSANTGKGLTYVWNKSVTPISEETSSTLLVEDPGSYSVTVSANGCSKTSEFKTVTVSTSKTVWYQDVDGDGKGDVSVSQTSCMQPVGYVSEFGDGCPTDATKLSPGLCGCGVVEGTCTTTGIVDLKSTDAIKIMPNPSSEQFNLVLSESAMIYISSVDGKLVETFSNVSELKFGSDYAKGVYVVQIMNGSSSQILRVIKQ